MELIGQVLKEIRGRRFETNRESFEEICLIFSEKYLLIEVNRDTDELLFSTRKNNANITSYEKIDLSEYENEVLKSIWQAKNEMNYNDLIIIGLGSFKPSIAFSCAASQIFISVMDRLPNVT